MNIEDIRQKYQCDASQTFAQWKEWVRKNKPSQAQAHIVKAVAPNGSKYERLIGGYTDAQNVAFDLVSHGYKDIKLYHSVNAGPLKLLRNFSAPLHGAKFKDSAEEIGDATATFPVKSNRNGNKYGFIEKICRSEAEAKALVDKLKKEGFVANYKKVMYRDEADGVEQIRAKYCMDAMVSKSELEKKKYTQFFVNGEDINGKVLRIPQRRFKKFEEAVRVAKSLQNANTRHVFVEGGWDNNQVEPKALYDWRNPKAK